MSVPTFDVNVQLFPSNDSVSAKTWEAPHEFIRCVNTSSKSTAAGSLFCASSCGCGLFSCTSSASTPGCSWGAAACSSSSESSISIALSVSSESLFLLSSAAFLDVVKVLFSAVCDDAPVWACVSGTFCAVVSVCILSVGVSVVVSADASVVSEGSGLLLAPLPLSRIISTITAVSSNAKATAAAITSFRLGTALRFISSTPSVRSMQCRQKLISTGISAPHFGHFFVSIAITRFYYTAFCGGMQGKSTAFTRCLKTI